MKNILTLPIDQTTKIEISVPEVDQKINYFYPVSESLHTFDEATVEFVSDSKRTKILKEALSVILKNLITYLNDILENKGALPENIQLGELGITWCQYAENLPDDPQEYPINDDIFVEYWLLSGIEYQVWIYIVNQKIILEVSPSYKWAFTEPKKRDNYISYQKFIKNYKPIAVIELDEKIVRNWLKKCQELLDQLKND